MQHAENAYLCIALFKMIKNSDNADNEKKPHANFNTLRELKEK